VKYALSTLRALWHSTELRQKLFYTLALIALFRLIAYIPLFGVDTQQLRALLAGNQFLGVLNIFSGGTLTNFSIGAIGIGPYITASILVQISGLFIPKIKEMQKESEATKAQIQQWIRVLSVPIGVMQSLSLLFLLRSQGLLTATQPLELMTMILSLVAGSVAIMWIGELLTKHGIGNGTSMVIFTGIISQIPTSLIQSWALRGSVGSTTLLGLGGALLFLMGSVVFMNEAVRRLPIQQAKRQAGSSQYGGSFSHLPLKVTQFGVMPIIFALPILTLPSTLASLILNTQLTLPDWLVNTARTAQIWFTPGNSVYTWVYFVFVFAFTFFSIFVYFNPKEFAEDLKKSGAYVPGVRPGKPTAQLLMRTLLRIAFVGGLYLAVVAVLPLLAQGYTGVGTLTIGGTGLLIVVSVVLENMQQIQAQLVHDQYDKYA
jgi:preprotein translocase subunit SecY